MHRAKSTWMLLTVGVLAAATMTLPARGQDLIKVRMSRLSFPSLTTPMVDVVKAQGFDKKNGIDLEPHDYGTIAAYYAAAATGEIDLSPGGPYVLQKMRNEGVPLRAVMTYARLNALGVITGDPAIKSLADLKGKTIAADMASSEYQVMSICGRSQGIVFGKDVTVVQAGPPLARTQLQAKRVEASMTWEPALTLTLRDNPAYRTIATGDQMWKSISKTTGWQLVLVMREEFLKKNPQAVPRLLKMFQEGAAFLKNNTDEADRVVVNSLKMPPGIFKEAISSGRMAYDIQPAWGEESTALWDMFKLAVDSGYLPKLPDDQVIWKP